ncbi:MAG: hypothetical protein ABI847_04920 [Anaerolineales bacterium]
MKKLFLALLCGTLWLAGCGQMGLEGQVFAPTEAPSATPVVVTNTALPGPTAAPTEAPTEPPTQAANVLPAPLYFISTRNNQIWRIERDGATATQVTREAFDIDSFDVSPVDGALVYVSNNTLIVSDANGGAREARINGLKVEATDYKAQWEQQIRNPRWRPDGQEIFFGQGGLNVIVARGEDGPHNILPASPYPDEAAGRPTNMPANYWPHSFSPNGSFLLAFKHYYPEGFSLVLVRLNSDAAPVELANDLGPNCCDISWSADSQTIYLGGEAAMTHGLDFVGLWKASVDDGKFQPLVRGYVGESDQPPAPGATFTRVSFPFEAGGQLYAFANIRPATDDEQMKPDTLGLARVAPDGTVTLVSSEKFQTLEAIGAADGSGGALVDIAEWNYSGPYPLGRLRWVPSDGSPAVDLVEIGREIRWGK